MAESPSVIQGWFTGNGGETQVQVRFASKFSLWVQTDQDVPDGLLDNDGVLKLQLGEKTIDLGRCKSFHDEGANGHVRRFAPTEGLHNFETLFSHSRIEVLESSLVNLALLLDHKDKIDPGFRDFVSDLTHCVFMQNLTER